MPWSAPAVPVSGTVITVAWATSSVVTPINWLRGLTGNGDPPGAGYSPDSTSTTLTTWNEKVNRVGDVMRNDLQINRSAIAAPTTGRLILGNDTTYYLSYDGSKHVLNTPNLQITGGGNIQFPTSLQGITFAGTSQHRDDSTAVTGSHQILCNLGRLNVFDVRDVSVIFQLDDDANTITFKGNTVWHAGNDTRVGVPVGAVVWFRTLAEVTSAGASWTRETNLDGRLPIGAGTTFSQTFAEATNYGANWTPSSGLTVGAIAVTADAPFLVNVGTNTNVTTSTHTHPAPTLNGSGTAWLPPMRAGIWARRI